MGFQGSMSPQHAGAVRALGDGVNAAPLRRPPRGTSNGGADPRAGDGMSEEGTMWDEPMTNGESARQSTSHAAYNLKAPAP
jgi:hypothetical protein